MGEEQTAQPLIPCSKCGGKAVMRRMTIGCQYFAECEVCGSQGPVSNYVEEAAELWNKDKDE